MTDIALLIAANLASTAPDRRADAGRFDYQLEILQQGFSPHGLKLDACRWTDPAIDWSAFGAVLVNCAWDYQDDHERFLGRLDEISDLGVPIFNSPDMVRWNIRKTYLRELEKRGVPVIPTLWPEAPTAPDIRDAMAAFGTDDVILKRQVGAGARSQVRFNKDNIPDAGRVLDRPGMIQPFIPSIATEGEYSFLFVDNEFSHALVKRAADGDYRIQASYGGRSHPIEPSPADLQQARAVLEAVDEAPLYARIDMVRGLDGSLMLMELEVIEPDLYVRDGSHIGDRLARALAKRLG